MRRFIIFGMHVIPESKHNKIVSELEAKCKKAEEDAAAQKAAYLSLAKEFDKLKNDTPARGRGGRFEKRIKQHE